MIAGLLAALPLAQLIPLPSQVALGLPGRGDLSKALALAGLAPGLSPVSLTPDLTWRAFLSLLPPLAMFGAVLTLNERERNSLMWPCLFAGIAAVCLCAVQIATQSPSAQLWSWTDPRTASGLFANRNHMAALCTATLPFAAAMAVTGLREGIRGRLWAWFGLSYLALMVIALAAIQSRAGVVIGLISLAASVNAIWVGMGRRLDRRLIGMVLVAASALLVVGLFGLDQVTERFDTLKLMEGRAELWPHVVQAAEPYMPLGSGIGSFDSVYRSVEPLQQLDETYFNAAHNDYLQIWLETGWLGVALLVAFLVWFARRSVTAWTAGADAAFQRAASIGIGAILLHSIVDYPLRTEALMVFFAFCCGILEFATAPRSDRKRA